MTSTAVAQTIKQVLEERADSFEKLLPREAMTELE